MGGEESVLKRAGDHFEGRKAWVGVLGEDQTHEGDSCAIWLTAYALQEVSWALLPTSLDR